jgi:hypothetical protein
MLIYPAPGFSGFQCLCGLAMHVYHQTLIVTQNVLGNATEQTANTYKLNACNKALIKTSKPNVRHLRLALVKHLLIIIIVNQLFIFNILTTILQ